MKRLLTVFILTSCLIFCSACATITGTDSQYVPVDTPLDIPSQDAAKKEDQKTESDDGTTKLSWKSTRAVKASSVSGDQDLIFLGELVNEGSSPLAIYSLKLELLDDQEKEIAPPQHVDTYPSVLEPGEKAFVCATAFNSIIDDKITSDDIASVDTSGEYAKIRLTNEDYQEPLLEISNARFQVMLDYPGFSCTVTNQSDKVVENAYVVCPIFSSEEILLSAITYDIKRIEPGESIEISQRAWVCDEAAKYDKVTIEPFIYFEEKVGR